MHFNNLVFHKRLSFILEIDKLKTVTRRNFLRDKSRNENSAEHSWHLALMAILFFDYAPPKTNLIKAIKMALIHDVVEVYSGDTFCFDKKANQDRLEREFIAASKIFKLLPDDNQKDFSCLWKEFEVGETSTSKFVIALDRLQPFLQSYYPEKTITVINGIRRQELIDRMLPIKEGLPSLWPFVEKQINNYFFSAEKC